MNSVVRCSVRNKMLVEKCVSRGAECPVRDIIFVLLCKSFLKALFSRGCVADAEGLCTKYAVWLEYPFLDNIAYPWADRRASLTARPIAWKHLFSINIKSLTGLPTQYLTTALTINN